MALPAIVAAAAKAAKAAQASKALRAAKLAKAVTSPEENNGASLVIRVGFGVVAMVVLIAIVVAIVAYVVLHFFSLLFGAGSDALPTAPGWLALQPQYAPMYAAAAHAYHVSPYALAALHYTESGFSSAGKAFHPNEVGANGPMQFMPGTWGTYAHAYKKIASHRPTYEDIECHGDVCTAQVSAGPGGTTPAIIHVCRHHPCITDDFDAIAAAALYLQRLGAGPELDQATYQAFLLYKGVPPASQPAAQQAYVDAQQMAANNGDGPAVVPLGASKFARLVALANQISDRQIPYCYGGGHQTTPARPGHGTYCVSQFGQRQYLSPVVGLDCSSAVSMLFQLTGYRLTTMTSTGFMSWGEPGAGAHVTIWANIHHVFLDIDGRQWGTSFHRPYGSAGWGPQRTTGFVPRHPPGL